MLVSSAIRIHLIHTIEDLHTFIIKSMWCKFSSIPMVQYKAFKREIVIVESLDWFGTCIHAYACRLRLSRVCPGRRPTTGSRQKYSAAKTEVASESLPVAPFARPALPASVVSLVLTSRYTLVFWRHADVCRGVMCSNLENKRPWCSVIRDRDRRTCCYFLC